MSRKIFLQGLLITAILVTSFATAGDVYAGGGCGRTVTVQWGDTLASIANICGTTVAALYAANPGLGYYIYAGQVLYIPGGSSYSSSYSSGYSGYGNTYIVRSGDTFAKIAARYGVSVGTLWSYIPQIWDINYIYAGQVVYVPGTSSYSGSSSYSYVADSAPSGQPDLSYGYEGPSAKQGRVVMTNNTNGEAYVSLQGTTNDGVGVIREYYVTGTEKATIPLGWYTYVVWVDGSQYVGQLWVQANHKLNIWGHKVTAN